MKKIIVIFIVLQIFHYDLFAQSVRKKVESGNELYYQEKYDEALNNYRDALIDEPESPEVHFNIGDSQYKIKKYDEALKQYEKLLSVPDAVFQSKVYYNIGNTMFRSGKIAESILSYKKALELNPDDIDAKFNLEFARNFLKEHAKKEQTPQQKQQQQKNQQQKGENKEKQESENQQEQQKSEAGEEKKKKDSRQKEEKKKEMTKEEAESILRALSNNEKKDLKNAKKMKVPGNVRVLKDW